MCKQILPTSTIRNMWRTMGRTCVLILWLKGLRRRRRINGVVIRRGSTVRREKNLIRAGLHHAMWLYEWLFVSYQNRR